MKKYEVLYVVDGTLDTEVIEGVADKFSDLIKENGDNVVIDVWGKRRLAYEVNKKWDGYYVLINFEGPEDFIAELERQFRLDENVMKYLITKVDEKKIALAKEIAEKNKIRAEKRAAAREAREAAAREAQATGAAASDNN